MLVIMKKIRSVLTAALLACTLTLGSRAALAEGNGRDILVYKDGDRLQGRLVEKTDKIIVFQSDRFGEVKVLVENAVVIKAEQTVAAAPAKGVKPAAAGGDKAKAADRAEAERLSALEHLSPAALTAMMRDFFGPWHGRFAFSAEAVSNTADQHNIGGEVRLQRKWGANEVQLNTRYDYSKTNTLTTTDLLKMDGLWRYNIPVNRFVLYRPAAEWNRASFKNGVPNDYVQLQQELGTGFSLLAGPRRQVRLGVSENLFDIWNTTSDASHTSRTVESGFIETELKLPWRMSLTQRGVYYYSFATGQDGWEDRVELSKKFTETLSTSIRHEIRRYNPNGTTQDYTRLKLLFGLDF